MIKQFLVFLFAVTVSAQAVSALKNPFNKTSNIDIGSDIKWVIKKGVANKTSTTSDNDGTFYQLRLTQSELSLHMLKSASGGAQSFDQLTIDDVQLDGKTITLFQWCLSNQTEHSRYLQQGLVVEKDVCQNKGKQGSFVMKLNQATYDLLKSSKNITFVIKPYRSAVIVSFDVPDVGSVFAELAGGGTSAAKAPAVAPPQNQPIEDPASKFISKSIPVTPTAKPKPEKTCSVNPPTEFASIAAIEYICTDEAAKASAMKTMAANVSSARALKEKQAAALRQKSKQSEADKLAREEEKKKEAEALLLSEQKRLKIQNEISEKMIGMCEKKWAVGEHRCYCEPYLKFAPAGIKSDPSCAGG